LLIRVDRKTESKRLQKKSKISPSFAVSIYVDDKKYWSGSFKTDDVLKSSNEDQKRGWLFTMKDPVDGDMAKVMRKAPTGNLYYLPFRNMPLDFSFVNPVGQGKWIETTMSMSKDESHKLVIQFEYQVLGTVINEEELRQLIGALNGKRNERQNFLKSLKSETNVHASAYYTNKQSFDAASKGIDGINSQISKYNTDLTALNTKQKSYQDSMETLKKNISEEEIKVSNLKNQQNSIIADMNAVNALIEETSKNIKALEEQKKSGSTNSGSFQTKMNEAKNNFSDRINKLLIEAPTSMFHINAASASLLTKNDLRTCTENLSKVYP
jgi:DNA repair exonuclease SbcCD ATPase subunit